MGISSVAQDRPRVLPQTTLVVQSPMAPPYWALLERELLRMQTAACQEFFEHYFDERGYLLCVPRWSGDDGADDAAENISGWTMLHAMGAPDVILALYKKGWEGHLRQYTEAKTVEVPFARDGMYYKEFPVMFDWIHNGEGLAPFQLQCLSDPYDVKLGQRMARFAGFYMGNDPQAQNYDPVHKVIRSMFNGSRGPLMRKSTGLDWAGDPIEIEGRFTPVHGEKNYEEMLGHFQDYNDVVGDHPLNLGTTTLAFNAYMLTGEEKYREWILEYVDAWVERTEANNGIIPTNIGLDGTIGGACDGKWYGGVYGWGFTVYSPQLKRMVHRPYFQVRCHYGFGNGLLLTGNQHYVNVWRDNIDNVNANARVEDGVTVYPYSYGDDGWYNFKPEPYDQGALEVYYWSMDRDDLKRLPKTGWIGYLEGLNPDYPVSALQAEMTLLRKKVEEMHADTATPDTRMSDDPNLINPATLDVLTELMLGGIPTDSMGYPLHCRLRYFDPIRRRAGIPEDVAALVEQLTADAVTVTLVNVNQIEARTLVVQGGAYGEHQFERVTVNEQSGAGQNVEEQSVALDASHFSLRLEPGCGATLVVQMRRYVNAPTCRFPWDR